MSNRPISSFSFADQVEVHYPTTVMEREYQNSDVLNEQLYDVIKGLADKYGETEENAVNSGMISTEGGYQTSTRLNFFSIRHAAVEQFKNELVLPAAQDYLRRVFGEEANQLQPWPDGWANLLREGDWQRPHFHPSVKNVVSGVYYVHLPEGKPEPEGNIEFFNPIPASVNHGFPSTRRLVPKQGKMILFPPYYVHYVHPFRGGGERAIIAFDILSQKPGGQFVF